MAGASSLGSLLLPQTPSLVPIHSQRDPVKTRARSGSSCAQSSLLPPSQSGQRPKSIYKAPMTSTCDLSDSISSPLLPPLHSGYTNSLAFLKCSFELAVGTAWRAGPQYRHDSLLPHLQSLLRWLFLRPPWPLHSELLLPSSILFACFAPLRSTYLCVAFNHFTYFILFIACLTTWNAIPIRAMFFIYFVKFALVPSPTNVSGMTCVTSGPML